MFTVSQQPREPRRAIPRSPLHAVALPLSEAVESIKVLLASLAVRRELLLARIEESVITPEECSLIYFPFTLRGTELIHPVLQVSISVNALNWGKLL